MDLDYDLRIINIGYVNIILSLTFSKVSFLNTVTFISCCMCAQKTESKSITTKNILMNLIIAVTIKIDSWIRLKFKLFYIYIERLFAIYRSSCTLENKVTRHQFCASKFFTKMSQLVRKTYIA